MENQKKMGRPKIKYGKKVTFNLSFETIKKLKIMTTLGQNASKFVEELINEEYDRKNKINNTH